MAKQNNLERLDDLYQLVALSEKLGKPFPEEYNTEIATLEEQLIKDNVLPLIHDNIEPTLRRVKRPLVLVVEYDPKGALKVNLSRKVNITAQISDAKEITPDPQAEHKEYGAQGKRVRTAPTTIIRVTFADGTVLKEKDAAATLVEAIRRIGVLRVRQVCEQSEGKLLRPNRVLLVSNTVDAKYSTAQKPVTENGRKWYVMTCSDTEHKKMQLEKIAQTLGIKLKVEILNSDNTIIANSPDMASQTNGERQLFTFNGSESLNKRRFVLAVVKDYLSKHQQISFKQLESVFYPSLQGGYGVVRKLQDVEDRIASGYSDEGRYFMDEPLVTADRVKFVVCNQWGNHFPGFVAAMRKIGYVINKV